MSKTCPKCGLVIPSETEAGPDGTVPSQPQLICVPCAKAALPPKEKPRRRYGRWRKGETDINQMDLPLGGSRYE